MPTEFIIGCFALIAKVKLLQDELFSSVPTSKRSKLVAELLLLWVDFYVLLWVHQATPFRLALLLHKANSLDIA